MYNLDREVLIEHWPASLEVEGGLSDAWHGAMVGGTPPRRLLPGVTVAGGMRRRRAGRELVEQRGETPVSPTEPDWSPIGARPSPVEPFPFWHTLQCLGRFMIDFVLVGTVGAALSGTPPADCLARPTQHRPLAASEREHAT